MDLWRSMCSPCTALKSSAPCKGKFRTRLSNDWWVTLYCPESVTWSWPGMDFSFLNADRAAFVAINYCISFSCPHISSSLSIRLPLPSQAEPWEAGKGHVCCLVALPWALRMWVICQFFVFSPVDIQGIFYASQAPGEQQGKWKPVFSGISESCFKALGH